MMSNTSRRRSIAYEVAEMVHMPTQSILNKGRRRSNDTQASQEKVKVVFDGYRTYQYFEFPDITPLKLRAMTSLESLGGDSRNGIQLNRLKKFLLSHRSSTRRSLIRICFVAAFYAAMSTPAFVAFGYPMGQLFVAMQYLVYALFWVDIVVEFTSTYQAQTGNDVVDHVLIAQRYIRTWFVVDLLAALPYHLYQDSARLNLDFKLDWEKNAKNMPSFWDFFQLVVVFAKFLREAIRLRKIGFVRYSSLGKAFSLLAYLLTLIQVLTVLLFIVCQSESSKFYEKASIGERNTTATASDAGDPENGTGTITKNPYLVMYVVYLHYATVYILGKGEPTCTLERVYALTVNVLGLFFTATVVGNVTHLIQQGNAKVTKWRAKMEEVNDSMLQMGISADLQKRIVNYYAFSWAVNGGEDKNFRWLEDLSRGYHEEAAIQVNENLIASVPIFRVADRAFVHAIIMKLQQQLYLPGDYIIKHGEIGDEMYFVVKGTVQAMDRAETVIYTILSEGSFFGEIALLKKNSRRTATVRSFTYSHLNVLYKKDFEAILLNFPKDAALLEAEAKLRERNSENVEKSVIRQKHRQNSRNESSHYMTISEEDLTSPDSKRLSSASMRTVSVESLPAVAAVEVRDARSSLPGSAEIPEDGQNVPRGGLVMGVSTLERSRSSRLSIEGAATAAAGAAKLSKKRKMQKNSTLSQVSPETERSGVTHNTIINLDADGEIDFSCSRAQPAAPVAQQEGPSIADLMVMIGRLSEQLQGMTQKMPEESRRVSQFLSELPFPPVVEGAAKAPATANAGTSRVSSSAGPFEDSSSSEDKVDEEEDAKTRKESGGADEDEAGPGPV